MTALARDIMSRNVIAVPADMDLRDLAKLFLDRVFGGSASPLLAHFLERSDLTEQEIEELRRLLHDKDPAS